MKNTTRQIAAAMGATGVAAGIAIAALTYGVQSNASAEPSSSTQVTQTNQMAPPTPEVPKAVPQITGPAPLPPEEQGLPG